MGAERTAIQASVPAATDKGIIPASAISPHIVGLKGCGGTAGFHREASERLSLHLADIAASGQAHAADRLIAVTIEIIVANGRTIFGTSGDLHLLGTTADTPTGDAAEDVAPPVFHTKDLHAGSLIIAAPEHTAGIHAARLNSRTIANTVTSSFLKVGALEHHGQQVVDQHTVCQNLGVPDIGPIILITYTEGRITKTASVPVTVQKVLVSIAVTNNPSKMVYHYLEEFAPAGMVVTAKFSDDSTEEVSGYTYPKTAFSTLGSRPVEIGYTYEGVTKTTSLNVTVNPIEVAVPVQNGVLTYDGTGKTPSWTGYDPSKMSISGTTTGVNAGTYSARFNLSYGYQFPGGLDEATVEWIIDRAVIASLPVQNNVLAANGKPQSPTWDNYDIGQLTIGGDRSGTDAGDYKATFTPTANYKWWDGSIEAKEVKWTITSVIVPIPTQKGSPIYTGAPQTPEWNNFDQVNSKVQVTEQTNAGTHSATFILLKGMWSDGSTTNKTVQWSIGRASIAKVPAQSGALKYDGNPKTPVWDASYDPNKMTVSVEAKVNAGTGYTATFTPDSNHQWWDGTVDAKTATWAIGKGDNVMTVSPESITLNMNARSARFTVTRKGDGTITATSDNNNIATIGSINQQSGEIVVNSVRDTSGTATITVKVAEGSNYLAPANKTVSVKASFREYLYGFDLNINDSNPATRVSYPSDVENKNFAAARMNFGGAFSYGGWDSTPGKKFMPRPCMLRFDGTVAYYLNPNDYTKKADGTPSDISNVNFQGNAMMEWPKIYVKRWESSGVFHFRCSDVKVDNSYECWCNYDKNNREIPHFYTPIFFGGKDSSNRLRSISGLSNFVSNTAQKEVEYATGS